MTNNKCLRVMIKLRDGSTKELEETVNAGCGDGLDLKTLSHSLLSLQNKVNSFLTARLEQERGTTPTNDISLDDDNDEDEDEEEDDEEEDKPNEPPVKLPRTR